MRNFFLITFFIVSCVCLQVDSAPPPPPAFPSYDIIQMVISWPPTYCKSVKTCEDWSQIKQRFSLHGLWPADKTGKSIAAKDCSRGPTFSNPAQLNAWLNTKATLVKELSDYWPSIIKGIPDDSFWKTQWDEHGVCSSSHICTNTYFEKAVSQSKKLINLLDVLTTSQIVPSDTELYTEAQIKSAVQKVIGGTNNVYISCSKIGQEIMLREIYICLDNMADKYKSCPAGQEPKSCGMPNLKGTIKFPPFPQAFPYAIIQMVMSWPPTYCQSGTPCKNWSQIKKRFSLHGLWPADKTGKSIAAKDCSQGPTFSNPAQLNAWFNTKATLVKELSDYWPSIKKNSKDDSFWQHEWNEHGVCSSSNICTNTYFEKGVEQSKKLVNLLNVLAASQIVPSATKLYTAAQIKSAVQKATGTTYNVYISCLKSKQNNVFMLREIYICLDKMARGYVSCPVSKDTRGCGRPQPNGTIKFPPFPSQVP